ncbi:MAG: glycosyltransferase family 2 protein [Muribaculaceae bacterium]|nr:glycosyltransferase family 2 protein [Muribaculaceae bacterium]
MPNPPELEVLIASFGKEGLERLSLLAPPEIPGVRWLVSSQIPDGIFPPLPENLRRKDICVKFSLSKGLAHNRNLLLDMAKAPLCLIGDDDVIFSSDGLLKIIDTFQKHPEISIAAFKYNSILTNDRINPDLSLPAVTEKPYPSSPFPLDRPAKGFYISAIEIAFRRTDIIKKGIRFNENFGINAPYPCGEDSIFLSDCLAASLEGSFFPIHIATHLGSSTGTREIAHPAILRTQGVLIPIQYPLSAMPRLVLKAWRSSKASSRSFPFCLMHILKGWMDFILYRKKLFPSVKPDK